MSRERLGFALVYEQNVSRVYGFLAYRVADRDLALDLTQETFERALVAWGRYNPERSAPGTWVLRIARNLLIDHHRRNRAGLTEPLEGAPEQTTPGPEEAVGGSAALAEALAMLSDREREVLALRFGGDLNGPEIAELLDLSLANVQQIISRALRKLRSELEASGLTSG